MRQTTFKATRTMRAVRLSLFAATALTLAATAATAMDTSYDGGLTLLQPVAGEGPTTVSTSGPAMSMASGPGVGLSFEGVSQVDVRALHNNFSEIPPDTNGAIGASQFFEVSNGAYAVYDKATGVRQQIWADGTFWAAAGQPASDGFAHFSNGDSRVLFDSRSQKWIIESFAASVDSIQIAISNDSNALHGFRSTTFTGFAGGTADYPTLAIDNRAVYIGTNDFDSSNHFAGVTLNVIKRGDLFGAGAPTASSLVQFFTPATSPTDRGFAIQGVNQLGNGDAGKIIAASNFSNTGDIVRYNVNNPGTAGATETASVALGSNTSDPALFGTNNHARQPDGSRTIDALDVRISSAAWEQHGKIYSVQTVTPPGTDHTSIVYTVTDAATNKIVDQGSIGGGGYDYYQGSIAVNSSGQVVIGYNRSGFGPQGKVSFYAATFNTLFGSLTQTNTYLLHVSPIDDYHNGSVDGAPAVGRQRWGDYAQVTVDPNNSEQFWAIGEFAKGYLPSPTKSFSRWGTWISEITLSAVPEPATWSMMLIGLGLVGGALRRRVAKTA